MDWISVRDRFPKEKTVVRTKIDDADGIRNEQKLVFYHGLWFLADMSVYVYYNPTHWMPINED